MFSLKSLVVFTGLVLILVENGSADEELVNTNTNIPKSTPGIQETLAIFGRHLKALFCGDVDTHPEDTLDEKQKRTLIAVILIPTVVMVLLVISCCICGWQVFRNRVYIINAPQEETMRHPYSTLETATDVSTMNPHLICHRIEENRTAAI